MPTDDYKSAKAEFSRLCTDYLTFGAAHLTLGEPSQTDQDRTLTKLWIVLAFPNLGTSEHLEIELVMRLLRAAIIASEWDQVKATGTPDPGHPFHDPAARAAARAEFKAKWAEFGASDLYARLTEFQQELVRDGFWHPGFHPPFRPAE